MSQSMIQSLESRRLFADFSVAFTSDSIPDSVKAGDKLKAPSATFSVASTGTLDKTQGKAKLTLNVAITNGATNVTTAKEVKITASSLAKKAKVAKAVFSALKVAPAAGTYTITATLGGELSVGGDANTANNTASTSLSVAAGTTTNPGGTSPFDNGLGNTITFDTTFSQTTPAVNLPGLPSLRAQTVNSGNWSDNNGNSGTFYFTSGGSDTADGAMSLTTTSGTTPAFIGFKWANLKAGKDAPLINDTTFVFGGTASYATIQFKSLTINVAKGKK